MKMIITLSDTLISCCRLQKLREGEEIVAYNTFIACGFRQLHYFSHALRNELGGLIEDVSAQQWLWNMR